MILLACLGLSGQQKTLNQLDRAKNGNPIEFYLTLVSCSANDIQM